MAVFDSSFLVDLLRGAERAVAMLDRIEDTRETQVVPAPVVYELAVELGHGRTPPSRARRVRAAIDALSVAPFTRDMAFEAGRLAGELEDEGRPVDDLDAMIAATALVLGERLVTRNRRHFERVRGLRLLAY